MYIVVNETDALLEYANASNLNYTFSQWLQINNYKFRVLDKIFNTFNETWEYLTTMNDCTRQNNGFEIIKEIN
jgi:hypothetical protein